ncbi:hypothetical protein BS47DRAFT_1371507 [Hydnum rufescens UP504]|uniref:Uncharacterized protein n=1 Tax=Hydnum rufescens UP504 TaxID=1448309 RepID=A0A9P6B465_9AGAM|nr:hypothetical protein BS47DRAFT_1371507 [Hydnum rufescens UP504]
MSVALLTAITAGKGPWLAQSLCKWTHAYLQNQDILPTNPYGTWSVSVLADEDLAAELHLHLQLKGKYITAHDIIWYISGPSIKECFGFERIISLSMATQWLKIMEYQWEKEPMGQYVNGHERNDVVAYHQNTMLPFWDGILPTMWRWNKEGIEVDTKRPGWQTVVWTHNESTFYAHDHWKHHWVHSKETAKPIQKGEGASLMVSDFCSADYGWLHSPEGEEACILFKPEIYDQVSVAAKLATKLYPHDNHVFAFDNATTHTKCPEDALSVMKMPKKMSPKGKNFLCEVTRCDGSRKPVLDSSGNVVKDKMQMHNGPLPDGSPQCVYFTPNHQYASQFKGMAVILKENGVDMDGVKLKAQCGKGRFKCWTNIVPPGTNPCCCQKAMFDQPNFTNQKSCIEELLESLGHGCTFYTHFHCKCNFIESNWGYEKCVYQEYPKSSGEDQLKANVESALASIPLVSMQRFANHSLWFMDAYQKGLNAAEAAWANKKYHGHQVLPESLMMDMDK